MTHQKTNKDERNRQYLKVLQADNNFSYDPPYEEEAIDQNKKFLIICEGKNTEVNYFRNFPVVNKSVTVFGGYPGGKKYLVEQAEKIADKEDYTDHEVWCVFDYDVKPDNEYQKQDYDNAIASALQKGYRVAYSNDCFELWFLLHYKLIQQPHHRTEYFDMLRTEWKLESSYETMGKEEKFTKSLYARLIPSQAAAIRHAKRLYKTCSDGRSYHEMNPCTTVFQLVEELNKYLRR